MGQLGGQHLFANLNYDLPLHCAGRGKLDRLPDVARVDRRRLPDPGLANFAVPFVVAAEANASVKDNVIRGKFEERYLQPQSHLLRWEDVIGNRRD